MTHSSTVDLLVLHAVRLLGFADDGAVAAQAGVSQEMALSKLREAESSGWVQYGGFFDIEGWSLTESGREENERQLAEERLAVDAEDAIGAVYRDFRPLNARLLRAVTDWQLKPTEADALEANDHADAAWDARVVDELRRLGDELAPLSDQLCAVLTRFDGYHRRYAAALRKVENGLGQWVDRTEVDSCHRVWFQLHEDLIATLGMQRGNEE